MSRIWQKLSNLHVIIIEGIQNVAPRIMWSMLINYLMTYGGLDVVVLIKYNLYERININYLSSLKQETLEHATYFPKKIDRQNHK